MNRAREMTRCKKLGLSPPPDRRYGIKIRPIPEGETGIERKVRERRERAAAWTRERKQRLKKSKISHLPTPLARLTCRLAMDSNMKDSTLRMPNGAAEEEAFQSLDLTPEKMSNDCHDGLVAIVGKTHDNVSKAILTGAINKTQGEMPYAGNPVDLEIRGGREYRGRERQLGIEPREVSKLQASETLLLSSLLEINHEEEHSKDIAEKKNPSNETRRRYRARV